MIHDVLNIALGVAIAQLVRPILLAAMSVVRDKSRGNYYRAGGRSFLQDLAERAMGVY